MEQAVDAGETQFRIELLLENSLEVRTSQCAYVVLFASIGGDPLTELLYLCIAELRRPAGLLFGLQSVDSAVSVGVAPILHEGASSCDDRSDPGLLVAFHRQDDDAEAVPLDGFGLSGGELAEAIQVAGFTFGDVDGLPRVGCEPPP